MDKFGLDFYEICYTEVWIFEVTLYYAPILKIMKEYMFIIH